MSGKDLEILLKKYGLTQYEAANLLEISRSTIQNLLKKEEIPPKYIYIINQKIINNSQFVINGNSDINFQNTADNGSNNKIVNSHIDMRTYNSESPDVLRSQIDELDRMITEKELRIKEKDAQIKEKDAQIKEKDAQIKDLHEIIKQLNRK